MFTDIKPRMYFESRERNKIQQECVPIVIRPQRAAAKVKSNCSQGVAVILLYQSTYGIATT